MGNSRKSAYNFLARMEDESSISTNEWVWIWRLNCPQKVKTLFGCAQDNVKQTSVCSAYVLRIVAVKGVHIEDTEHVLYSCPKAKMVWDCFDPNFQNRDEPLYIWLKRNLLNRDEVYFQGTKRIPALYS